MRWVKITDLISSSSGDSLPPRPGCYQVRIRKGRVPPTIQVAQDRIIYIGGMTTGERSSIRKRVGLFISAAMGFGADQSGGRTVHKFNRKSGLTVIDLEVAWEVIADPRCREVVLYDAYLLRHQGSRPLLCKRRPSRCKEHS
jgi:hypothetical protein